MGAFRAFLLTGCACAIAAPASAQVTTDQGDETIIVTGIRRSIEDSIRTKREANSIVDVISAEDVGRFPDSNIADSLARLPGVTVDRQFGEGEQLAIAGVEPALNRLTIDGHSVASADWGGNPSDRSSRSFNYSLLSPTIISQAVVYKTPEARLQEGAIGATVDVVTRRPLDLDANTFAFTGGFEYNDRAERGSFRGSGLYSWRNQDETLGFLVSANYDKEQLSRAGIAVYWYRFGREMLNGFQRDAAGNIAFGADGRALGGPTLNGQRATAAQIAEFSDARHAAFLAREFFRQERERIGLNGAIQSRPADNLTVTATALVIRGNYDNVSNSEYTYGFDGAQMTAAEFSNGIVTSATFAPVSGFGASGQLDTLYRRTRLKNDTFSLLFDWQPGEWGVTGNFGTTRASGGKDPEYLLDFRTRQGFTSGANGRDTFVNWQFPASDATRWEGNLTALGPETNNDSLVVAANGGRPFVGRQIGGVAQQFDFTLDKEVFGEINFTREVAWGPVNEILFGARYVDHTNSNTTFGGQTFTTQNFTLADTNFFVQNPGLYNGLRAGGNASPYATLGRDGIIDTLERFGTLNVARGLARGGYWLVNEEIYAGYVQANFQLDRFRGNLGGRFVSTKDESNFYVNDSVLTQFVNRENRFLPAANLIYDAGDDVVLRGAVAKVIARPRYSDLAGSLTLNDTGTDPANPSQVLGTGGGGNPNLRPYAATNFGLSAEWYFAPQSFLAGEVFYRDITNYIGNAVEDDVVLTNPVTGRTGTYSISRPINAGGAQVTGFSLSGNAVVWRGFGVQGSYTFADAQTEDPASPGLPFLSRHTFTIVPYVEFGPIQARVSYNRRSNYFNRFGRQASRDYADAYRFVDAQISYSLNDQIQITATAANLLDETYYQYSTDPRFPTSLYKTGRVFSLSASIRM